MTDEHRVLRWEKPPPPARGPKTGYRRSQWDTAAAELRQMAGVWGVIYEGPRGRVATLVPLIRTGGLACFAPAGTFEAVSRNSGDQTAIYARFVGDEGEAES